jgi:hypothetical protein
MKPPAVIAAAASSERYRPISRLAPPGKSKMTSQISSSAATPPSSEVAPFAVTPGMTAPRPAVSAV